MICRAMHSIITDRLVAVELAALCSVETKDALRRNGVVLTRYRDL